MKRKNKKKDLTGKKPAGIKEVFEAAHSFHEKGEIRKAEEGYLRVLRMDSNHPNALNLLGTIYLERGELSKARDFFQRAVKSYPAGAMFHNNLGNVLFKMGLYDDAEKSCREAVRLDPDNFAAYNNLGNILHEKGDMEEAVSFYEEAYRKNPGFAPAYYNLGRVFCDQGKIDTSIWSYREALKLNPSFSDAYSNLLYTLHLSDRETLDSIFSEHKKWAEVFAAPLYPADQHWDNDRDQNRRLKTGFVSPDFKTHSVAFFLEDLFANLNREKIEIFCYSNTEKQDDFTLRFKELADQWRNITSVSDDEAVRMIKDDRIDILIDLAGHTRGGRLQIFAEKPAPVQVTWLGYPNTTGLETVDYRITDNIADPPGKSDLYATEKLVRIEGGFLCYRPSGEFFPVSPSPALSTGAVTFGSFNNNAKISDRLIYIWSEILKRTPGSRLKLKSRSFSDFGTRKHILERFETYGILSERLWFEGYKVSLKEHFLLYNSVDIALDTFPYNGTTTTCEALWMGVPVVVLAGDSHVSRVGASILVNNGLDALVAGSEEEYIEKAVNLSFDINALSEIRLGIRNSLREMPILDPSGFSLKFENALRDMWVKWVSKNPGSEEKKQQKENFDFLEKNLNNLRKFHPYLDLEKISEELAPFSFEVRANSSGIHNLLIKNKDGKESWLYPFDDPLYGMDKMLDTIKDIKGRVICVLGASLFIHANNIMEKAGKKNIVVFFEPFHDVFIEALKYSDFNEIITNRNVRFAVGSCADPHSVFYDERDKLFTSEDCEFVEYKNGISLAHEWYAEKKNRFEQFFKRKQIDTFTASKSAESFVENCFKNLPAIMESNHIDVLSNVYKNTPAVIVASGPSLSKNINELKNASDKALIIALDSALSPLIDAGITPHMVVSLDNNSFTFEKYRPVIGKNVDFGLVYAPAVTEKIPNAINFRSMYYTFSDSLIQGIFNYLTGTNNSEVTESFQSVIHLAIHTAQKAGCNPVIFTGLDLAFSGSRDHADGTILHWGNKQFADPSMVSLEGVDGEIVSSSHGFTGMLEIIQRMIETDSERIYIDATEGGARIRGTQIVPLSEAIDMLTGKSGVFQYVNMDSPPKDIKNILQRIDSLIKDFDKCIKKTTSYFTEFSVVEKYLENHKNIKSPDAFPSNILKSVRSMDRINIELENSRVVEYSRPVMAEFYNQYRELELDVENSSDSFSEKFTASLKQQRFVQEIRKKALEFYLDRLEDSKTTLRNIISAESDKSVSSEEISKIIEMLIDKNYLVKAESLLNRIEDGPEKEFFKGCIALKKGLIKTGKENLDIACKADANLSLKARKVIESNVKSWIDDSERLISFEKITADRIYELSDAFDGVFSDYHINWKYLAITVCLHISNSRYKEGLNVLETLSSDESSFLKAIDLIKSRIKSKKINFVVSDFLNEAKNFVKTKHWAKLLAQELFLSQSLNFHGKTMRKEVSYNDLYNISQWLSDWGPVKDCLPEWYYIEAFRLLACGKFEESIISIDRAIEVESKTVKFKEQPGFLQFCKGQIFLYRCDEKLALKIFQDLYSNSTYSNYGIKLSLLLIRNGCEIESKKILEKILMLPDTPERMYWIADDFLNGNLESYFRNMSHLPFYAAFNAVVGKTRKDNKDHTYKQITRGSVNHDPRVIDVEGGEWIKDMISEFWDSEIKTIMADLEKKQYEAALIKLDEWKETRHVIENYHAARASVISVKDGTGAAINYIYSCTDELSINPNSLYHVILNFFDWNRFDEAVSLIEHAINLNSNAALLWEHIGDYLSQSGNSEQALNMYEKSMAAFPEKHEILVKIGDSYSSMGQTEAAEMAYRTFINMTGKK